jgi:biotin carboxylase
MAHVVFVESIRVGLQALEVARRLGHRVTYVTSHQVDWLLTEHDKAARHRHSDLVLEVSDTRDVDVLTEAFRQIGAAHPIDAVLSTLQQFVEPSAIAAARLGLRATSPEGVRAARDKVRCRSILRASNIPSACYRMARSLDEAIDALAEVGYPAVVKPSTGVGKLLTAIVHDEKELRAHFASATANHAALRAGVKEEISLEFVIEEMLRGPLYSVELGVSAHGEHIAFAILKRKLGKHNPVLELGSTIPSGLSDSQCDRATEYCAQVVTALGLDLGIFHVELIYTADGPRLVEVNPRICGGVNPELINNVTGGDMFEYLVRIHLGERIGFKRLPYSGSISSMNIAAFENCVVRSDLPVDWFEPFKAHIVSNSMNIVAGQALRRMETNYDNYGYVCATAHDYASAFQRAEELRRQVEAKLGVKLVEAVD